MASPLSTPPGPIGLPLLGVLLDFRRNPAEYLLKTSQKFGEVSHFRIGLQKMYFINRPDLIEEVLVTNPNNFIKSRMLQRAKGLLGEGLLTAEGAHHIRQRKLSQPAFYRDRLAAYAGMMTAAAEEASERWENGATLEMTDEMMHLTLRIVGLTLFSRDVESDAAEIGQALTDVISTFETMLLPFSGLIRALRLGPMAKAERAQKILDTKIYELIRERREAGRDRGDLLSTLLAMAEGGEAGMTDKQVRDEAMTLMLAGHETTATALTWAWFLLSQHPDVESKLRAEWRMVLGGREPTFDDLPALVYTERVFAESMRLYPPAWALGRQVVNQFRLFNFIMPAGSICIMSPYVMHRNPRFWPDPETFDPERFTPEAKAGRPKFAYFPFGGGPRVCLGERFAWMEGALVLATIGQNWRFRMAGNQLPGIHPQITLRPRGGIRMTAERVIV
ncbi:MAG: cytochrome P450 [Bryobacteraceae bacterium]|nr:cytochrome P450 [Bryobacteraceae bacterium]